MAASYPRALLLLFTLMGSMCSMSTASELKTDTNDEAAARAFIAEHERTVRPLERAAALAWWNANVSGRDQDFKAKEDAQNRLDAALADPAKFDRLKAIKAAKLADPSWPGRSTCSTCSTSRSRSIPSLLKADHGQGQR